MSFLLYASISGIATSIFLLGKNYYNQWRITTRLQFIKRNTFTIHRIIDNDCNGKVLTVGICSSNDPHNVLSHQGIRWGDEGEIKRLVTFTNIENDLYYNFEDNVDLVVNKKENGNVVYSLDLPDNSEISKEVDYKIRECWKTISMQSTELDTIFELK